MFLANTIVMMRKLVRIAAVAASGGTVLPVVVMALGTAMIMFGASDTIEGIGDIQAAISRQGLGQMSYNPVRESVFGGNETAYTLTEMGVSFVFDVITGMAIAKMPTRLKTPAQAFRATSTAGVAKESGAAASEANGTVWNFIKETQPSREGSIIPKSFEIQAGGNRYWVAPNATEHMYEYSTKHLSVTATELSISPSQRMVEQTLLSSFQRAVEEASRIGYTLDDAIRVGNWELAFSKPRKEGLLTAIIHAVYKPKWS